MIEPCNHDWFITSELKPEATIYRRCSKCDLKLPMAKDELL
jgi:hypothetical protein